MKKNKIKLPQDIYQRIGIKEMKEQAKKYNIINKKRIDKECEYILKSVSVLKPKLLEIGYGYGRLAKELAKNSDYIGLDIIEEYYKYCSEKYPKVNFLLKDFFEYEYEKENDNYDIVVFPWTVLGHYPFEIQVIALKKAINLINPGGTVVIHWRDFNSLDAEKKNIKETKDGYTLNISNEILSEMKFFFPKLSFWKQQAKSLNMDFVIKKIDESDVFILFKFN